MNTTIAVTVILALLGYAVKYVNDLRMAQRKDRLDRISRQLKDLYGPLFSLTHASSTAWDVFRQRYRPSGAFWGTPVPPTDEEAAAWRLWMTEVFMPLNVRMEKVVLEAADLIEEVNMPTSFVALCAHVEAYRVILKKWDAGDFSEHIGPLNFPVEIEEYVTSHYNRLKQEQAGLLGSLR
jgi:hypothetical protein